MTRRPFEQLVRALRDDPRDPKCITLGELAAEFKEPVDRIVDALDTVKMLAGIPTYIDGP